MLLVLAFTAFMGTQHADTVMRIDIPEQYWDADSLDRHAAIHPSVLYFEDGWNGYKYWMAMTPYDHCDASHENPCIRVSNDNVNWTTIGPDPLFSYEEVIVAYDGHLSDVELFFDGRLWLFCRAAWNDHWGADGRSFCIVGISTTDGTNWTDPEIVLVPDNSALSPAVLVDSGYTMFAVNAPGIGRPGEFHSVVEKYTADTPLGPWILTDTIDIPLNVWHLDVMDFKGRLFLLTEAETHDLYLYNGQLTPLLQGTGSGFNRKLYKSCAVDFGGYLGLYYGTWGGSCPDGIAYTELFQCGDANRDGQVANIVDLTAIVDALFGTGDAYDLTGDGVCDIVDLTVLVDYLFSGGAICD